MKNIIIALMIIMVFSVVIQAAEPQKQKFMYKKNYYDAKNRIEKSLQELPELGFLWRSKGLLYLFDYNFKDGNIKANLKEAEKCFRTAIEKQDFSSYYLLTYTLNKEGKTEEALSLLEYQLNTLRKLPKMSKYAEKDYLDMSNLYAGIVLDKNLPTMFVEKAIDFSYPLAYYNQNRLSQLQVGLLYRKIGKSKQAKFFVGEACVHDDAPEKVKEMCKRLVIITKKNCEECKIKKSLGL